jgi:hypothetical protein
MKRIFKFNKQLFGLFFLGLIALNSMSQTQARVENVVSFKEGENLIITYDIYNSQAGETFDVSVSILIPNGKNAGAFTFTGDVGPGVYGGQGKRIVWDAKKDNVAIDDQVSADVKIKPEVAKTYVQPASPGETTKRISMGNALIQSLVFPGWGNMSVKGGGAYWVMGIAGYASIGAAFYFNNKADNTYQDYRYSTLTSQRDQLFSDAESYKQTQNALMYTAAGIWVIDLIWTGIQANNANKRAIQSKVDVGYYYNPVAKKPMVMFTYKL